MASRLMFVKLVAGFFCFCQQSRGSVLQNIDSLFQSNLKYDISEDTLHETIHLFKCPGSSIESPQNISSEFFRKYGLIDQLGQQDEDFSLIARFTESDPECASNSIFTSEQSSAAVINDTQEHSMLLHGWILKYYSEEYWESIPPNKYCIIGLDDNDKFSIKYCRSDCKTQPCISKCCFANEVCDLAASVDTCHCIDSGTRKWTSTVEQSLATNYSFVHYLSQSCDSVHFTLHQESVSLNSSYANDFEILPNGSVKFHRIVDGKWISFPEGTYCLDGALESRQNGEMSIFSGNLSDMVLHLCRSMDDLEPKQKHRQQFILFTILVPFATVFILLTIIVYILTWQEQNIHGYTNFFYLVTLLALYVFIVLSNARGIGDPNNNSTFCAFLAGAIHFSYLSSACWVTCISYDVWRRFKKMNSMTVQSRGKRRFGMFCVFSIGYPLIQVSTCAILDAVYRDKPVEEISFVLPNYGRFACQMSNNGLTYYLYVPITILLVCNIAFFVATIISMVHYKKSIREAFAESSNTVNPSKANQSFGIYTRLFIIMGLFWASQIISWFVLLNVSSSAESLEVLFAITDALTVLQAVAIFYIFVCKRNVFANLWTLHPWLRPFLVLWVKNGCCTTPSLIESRKAQIVNSVLGTGRRGTLKDTTETAENNDTNRNSRGSASSTVGRRDIVAPDNNEDFTRQSSLTSDVSCATGVSDDDGAKVVSVEHENELTNEGKISETIL